jgi:NADH dehydrogenase
MNNFDNWTIFRPSVVYGNPGEKIEFLTQLKNDIIDKPIPVPLFFQINPFESKSFFRSSPVHVKDLSKLIVKSLDSGYSKNRIHKVGGPDETTWYFMLKSICRVLNNKKLFILLPIVLLQFLAKLLDRFSFFPITSAQLKMLNEDNICDSTDLFDQYKITPTKFTDDSIGYLNQKQLQ